MQTFLRRRVATICLFLVFVLFVLAFLPSLLAWTRIADRVISATLADSHMEFEYQRATLSWFGKQKIYDLELRDEDRKWKVTTPVVELDRSFLQLLGNQQQLGALCLNEPTIQIDANRHWQSQTEVPESPDDLLEKSERDVRINLLVNRANIDVITASSARNRMRPMLPSRRFFERQAEDATVTILPGRIIDRANLTPALCEHGLHFIAPILADVAWTQGQLSLDVVSCKIRLSSIQDSTAEGDLTIHQLITGLRNPLAKQLTVVLRPEDENQSIQIANESKIGFEMSGGRVHHSGLEFGLAHRNPPFLLRSEGSVGIIDESLDLLITVPLPSELIGGPLGQALAGQEIQIPVAGTLEKPELNVQGDGQFASELLSKLAAPVVQGDISAQDVLDQLKELRDDVQQRRNERKESGSGLLQRLRQRIQRP
ncbi:MAG: hypothetical protein R3C28_16350 [Pirellulaceae bacterium]